MRIAFSIVILALVTSAHAESDPTAAGKKLIEYGWDCPDPKFIRQNVREMEKRPFDGIVIRIPVPAPPGKRGPSIGWRAFGREKIQPADYEHALADLRATKFEKFTDNFIQVITQPGDIDWFDDQWDSVLHNIRVMAKIAREGKCVGLMIDPEEYGAYKLWTYAELPENFRKQHTQAEYEAKVRERGEQIIREINGEFPKIKILFLFGPALTWDQRRGSKPAYSLLAPFIEGMCRAADDGTQITDGFEQSYMYRTASAFDAGRRNELASRELFEDKSAFDRVMRVGFGLWIDNGSNVRPWMPDQPDANHFQPDTWQSAINFSLSRADEYVWVYSQDLDWWKGEKVSADYEAAQVRGRDKPGRILQHRSEPSDIARKFMVSAGPRQDANLFADLMKDHEELATIPADAWRFRTDPDEVGESRKWFGDVDDSDWTPIEIAKFWEEQSWDYDGVAWYRAKFKIDSIPAGKKIELVIGAADESAMVWLNGQQVGVHDIGEIGWDQRFTIDVTDAIRAGENVLAIRVLDRAGPGGIWRPVKLLVSR